MSARRRLPLAALAIMVIALLVPELLSRRDSPRLNVVVIVTDDQSADSIPRSVPVMPYLQARALDPADHWVVFTHAFVNTPLCCPSRATLLTGRYPHHTGVWGNRDGTQLDEGATLAAWLDAAGYETALVGKYLNGYPFGRGPYVPAGWDRWWGKQQGGPESIYHDFTLIEQGTPVRYGASAYATDVLADAAVGFIEQAPSDRPFFLWFAPTAPHPPAEPAPRHVGRYADLPLPSPPSLGEPDVSDKPAWVRALPPLGAADIEAMREAKRRSFETLLAVDEAVRRIVEALRERGELEETVIVFTSDNGLAFGEHRWDRKSCPYEECIRVPLLVRVPGLAHRVEPALVSAVDLAPTILDLVNVRPGGPLDGASRAPLLRGGPPPPQEVYLEFGGDPRVPAWQALRRPGWLYVELSTGERELYDLRRDPFELANLARDPSRAAIVADMADALARHRAA
jgi:arylsulfatase A-like enzyme